MEFQSGGTQDGLEVRLTGRLEFTDHDKVPQIVDLLDSYGLRRAVLDVSKLEFIDSAGLGMLLIFQEEAEERNVRLVVRGPTGDVRRSIELAKLNEIISIEA